MSQDSDKSWWLMPSGAEPPTRPGRADSLGLLERFGGDLQTSESSANCTLLFLNAVHAGLDADAVFLWSGTEQERFQCVGPKPLAPDWCDELVRELLLQAPGTDSQLLRSVVGDLRSPQNLPSSVAMIRLSRTKQIWIVALSFTAEKRFTTGDMKIMALARRQFLTRRQHDQLYQRYMDTVYGLVRGLTAAIDAKDCYTQGHSERVARIAVRLGQELKLPSELIGDLYMAGLLHDIGKIQVREEVLGKPSPLTTEEAAHMRQHAALGHQIVAGLKQLEHLGAAVRHHHERWDGTGYPDGLVGEKIPLLARILAVADAFDAMLSDRPFRPALPPDQVERTLANGAGSQWDPQIIAVIHTRRKAIYALRREVVNRHDGRRDTGEDWTRASCGSVTQPAISAALERDPT